MRQAGVECFKIVPRQETKLSSQPHTQKLRTNTHANVESKDTVTGGGKVKAACVSDTLHLNQL